MPTENRRVATYLPKEVDDRLDAFKTERGIKGDSQALIVILSEFLGVSHSVDQLVAYSTNFVSIERFEDLAFQVDTLSKKLDALLENSNLRLGELPKELPSELSIERPDELSDVIESSDAGTPSIHKEIEAPAIDASTLPGSEVVSIQAAELAKRLNVGQSTISTKKRSSSEDFAGWTRAKDPDGVAWTFVADLNRFQPIDDVLPEVLSKLQSKPLIGLTTGDLAKRIGVDSSTLSHRKKEKTPEELTDWIRKRDPDEVGWIFLPEFNRFKPEVEVLGSSQSVLQGSLLNAEPLIQVNPLPKGSEQSGEG